MRDKTNQKFRRIYQEEFPLTKSTFFITATMKQMTAQAAHELNQSESWIHRRAIENFLAQYKDHLEQLKSFDESDPDNDWFVFEGQRNSYLDQIKGDIK